MLSNYLKIALRALRKQSGYAAINVFGLAVGIAFCALIFLYVRDELTHDRFHRHADRIVRAHRIMFAPDGGVREYDSSLPFPAGPAFTAGLPEVEQYVRLFQRSYFVRHGDQAFEEEVLYADPQFLDVFSFPLLQGNPQTALGDLNNVVLTETTARKYFGDANPMGRQVEVRISGSVYPLTVTGVAADVPGPSSIRFDVLVPIRRLMESVSYFRERQDSWNSSAFQTYLLLAEGASVEAARAKMPGLRKTYYPNEEDDLRARGLWTRTGMPASYGLQRLTDIHLNPDISGLQPTSDPAYAYVLAALALAVLLIACINFMTLAIGRSARRALEIGVRKVAGAGRWQLMVQFWGEALLLSGVALAAGLALAELFLPVFNDLAAKDLAFDAVWDGMTGAALLGVMLLTSLIAGSYPAVVLSRLRPIETLKNTLRLRGSNALTRSLVVVQFALSIFLIASTLVMLDQLDYLRTWSLGFDEEHVVVIDAGDVDGAQALDRYRNALAGRPEIAGLTGSSLAFARGLARLGFEYDGELKQVVEFNVEADYLDVMGMELTAGRAFDPRLATDSSRAVIVNEALVREFGWTDPLGEQLTGATESPETDPEVIGVVRDFNFASLHNDVEPIMLMLGPKRFINYIVVRVRPNAMPAALEALRTTWAQVAPDVPFQYSFLDDDLDRQYRAEEQWSRIVGYGALFAVLIACLGLFSLTALTVAGRTKEVGIRKVLGASVARVTLLLTKDFAKLVGIAVVLAAPAAYFVMRSWLNGFVYRIDLGAGTFVLAGLLALGIALATVSTQAVRAALADPVESLRYE